MDIRRSINTAYLRGSDPDDLRRSLIARVRSSPMRTMRELDNRVNLKWFTGRPYWYRAPGSSTSIIGMNPTARKNFLYPNILRDIVRTLTSVMSYDIDVDAWPMTSDPGDQVRAEMDQHIGRHLIAEGRMNDAKRRVVEMANLYADGYMKVIWDPDAGERTPLVNVTVCPTCSNTEVQQAPGYPIFRGLGAGSGAVLTDFGVQSCPTCSAQGVQAGGQPIGQLGHITEYLGDRPEGDVQFVSVHPDDMFIDPDATKFDEAEEICHRIRLSPERAWSRYGSALGIKQEFFENLPADAWDAPGIALMRDGRPGDTRYIAVTEYYRRPNEKHPEGVFSVSVADKCFYADALPYLHGKHWHPFFRYEMYSTEGEFFPMSTADIVLPLVLAYADQFSAAHFRAKESARMRWKVPDSVGIRHNNDTGNVHYRDKPSAPAPEPITLGPVPSDVSEMREQLLATIDRISGATDILRGQAGGAESGLAMSFLEERAVTPLKPVIAQHASTDDDAIKYAITLAKMHYDDGRVIRNVGINGGMMVKVFKSSDLGSGADVKLSAVKSVGRSRASQMAELNDAAERQMITPEEYKKLAEFGDLKGLYRRTQPHKNMAVQEHETLERTGDIQMPLPTEDHACHIEEHTLELNAIKMRDPNSPLIPALLQHVSVHKQMKAQLDVEATMYQQQAMATFGAANAANPDFQPAATQEAAQAQGVGGPSSSPAGSPPSEPFPNQNAGLGEQTSYAAAGERLSGTGGV